jgi:hypothetical protein
MKRLRSKLTYANVVSTLCLFLLLGGTAYATLSLPKNSVGPRQLKPNSVNGSKVKKGSIAASDLSSGALKALIPVTPYSKTESDARYLRGTIAEVKSFKLGEGSGESSFMEVTCPKGYQAIGGGVDTSDTLNVKVSASTPTFENRRPEQFIGEGEHQEGPATGWFGAITVQGSRPVPPPFAFDEVVVICSPIG